MATAANNPHAYVTSSSGERYTPPYIIEPSRYVLGGQIDYDPASSEKANEIVKATRFGTVDDSPLDMSPEEIQALLYGHGFWNPPGSCRNAEGVLEVCGNDKVCSCRLVQRFGNMLLSMHSDNSPASIWIGFHLNQLQSLQWPLCFTTCILHTRIPYLDDQFNVLPSPPHGSYVTLVTAPGDSEYLTRFKEVFAPLGRIVVPIETPSWR